MLCQDQFQAHKPKIIPRTARYRPTHQPPGAGPERRRFPRICPGGKGFRHPQVLRRRHPRPKLDWAGRAVLAALARLLCRSLRMRRLVTTDTVLEPHTLPSSEISTVVTVKESACHLNRLRAQTAEAETGDAAQKPGLIR